MSDTTIGDVFKRIDKDYVFDQEGDVVISMKDDLLWALESLALVQLELSKAAEEINCAGPVDHRIRVLKREYEDHIEKLANILYWETANQIPAQIARQYELKWDHELGLAYIKHWYTHDWTPSLLGQKIDELEKELENCPRACPDKRTARALADMIEQNRIPSPWRDMGLRLNRFGKWLKEISE